MNSEFDTEQYLISKRNQNYVFNDPDFPIIDRLCKKVDVVKKVYKVYSADLSSKVTNEEVECDRYKELFELLLSAAGHLEDYKFINTALKLNDILLGQGFIDKWLADINIDRLSDLMEGFSINNWGASDERT